MKLLITLLAISVALIALDSQNLLTWPKAGAAYLTAPIQFGFYRTGQNVTNQFSIVTQVRRVAQENKAMTRQMEDLLAENAQLRKQLAETRAQVEQQNSIDPETFDLLPARPIGISRYLTIDRGSADGVQMGQVVLYKDQYIGQVKEVGPKTAQLMLVTDPDSKLAVYTQNNSGKARGVLEGQFGSEGLITKILHQETLAPDDLVYSEGTEGRLPKGLIMGRVTQVMDNPNEVFKQAKVRPIFTLLDLDLVFIIRN